MARVVLDNLLKIFKGPKGEEIPAVNRANLVIEDQELLVLVGPSGCGKSTTLRLIAGLEEPAGGTIAIDGRVVNDLPPKDRDVAMVFQNHALYPHLTVYENLALGLRLRKIAKPEIERRVREAAATLDLLPCLDRLPKALSGGQRQRVAVGRALVRQPKVLLLDEPLSNLDPPMRVQLRAELSRLHTRLGATMLYVTHDQVEAMTLGHRIAVMNAGVIRQVAGPLELYHAPANLFVAGFIGSPPMNFFRGTLRPKGGGLFFVEEKEPGAPAPAHLGLRVSEKEAGRLTHFQFPISNFQLRVPEKPGGRLADYIDKPLILGLRPEDIHCHPGTPPLENVVPARVEVVEPLGAETYLHLTAGAQAFIARVPPATQAEVNQPLTLVFDMAQAHFFDPVTEQAVA